MSKKKDRDVESVSDGSRVISKFHLSDVLMMLFLSALCLTCILPFLHLAAKSISDNSLVLAKKIYFWPKEINFDA